MSIAPEKNTEFASMNNQLLNGDADEEKNIPKRNSKDDLIAKLTQCCEDNEIKLEYSNTKLRRMGKTQLQKLLAEKIEIALRNNMSAQVGAPPGSSDKVVALGALRMIHDLCAVSAERTERVFTKVRLRGGRVCEQLEGAQRAGGGRHVSGRNCAGNRRPAVHPVPVGQTGHCVVGGTYDMYPSQGERAANITAP